MQFPEQSRYEKGVYIPRHPSWCGDPQKEDIADTLCTFANFYHRRMKSLGWLPNSHTLGVAIEDLRPLVEMEASRRVQEAMRAGFGPVPTSHPLHLKGRTHTIILCIGQLSSFSGNERFEIAKRFVFNAMTPLLLRRADRIHDFAKLDRDARTALIERGLTQKEVLL